MMLRISIEHVLKEFSSIVAFKEFQHKPVGVIFRVEDAVSASAQNGVEPLRGELHVLIQVGVGSKEKKDSQAERIIALLGGRENIVLVDACMTRLRVTVKDVDKVAELPAWKAEGALGLLKKDGGIQAVYGPKADVLKSDINDIL